MKLKNIKAWIQKEHRMIYFEYGALALVVMLPLLLPGFILTLDMVFVPHLPPPDSVSSAWPLEALLWLLNFVLPGEVIQKLVMFTILILSGAGMHRLVISATVREQVASVYLKWGAYFAGIFYMINPFTYSRFMAGQWMVLLGYALLPFFCLSLLRFVGKPSRRTAVNTALWATAVSVVSVHQTAMLALLTLVAFGLVVWRYRGTKRLRRTLRWGGVFVGLALVLNSFWLIPTLAGKTETARSLDTFDSAHYDAFATGSEGPFGTVGNVLRLQGFWVESRNMYLLPQDRMPMWGLIAITVWVLVGVGVVTTWRTQRDMAILLGAAGALGLLLAATPLAAALASAGLLPNGYREPHKFATLIALAYAYFGAVGVTQVAEWVRQRWGDTALSGALGAALLIPLLFTPVMVWGFGGQLSARSYPADWSAVNDQLRQDGRSGRGLFLPWHQYMHFDFAGRTIANPAEKFFDTPIVISDDPEYEGISPAYPDDEKRRIEAALERPDTLVQTLNDLGVGFILLAKESDQQDYAYLDQLPGLQLVSETETLKYYKNEAYQP